MLDHFAASDRRNVWGHLGTSLDGGVMTATEALDRANLAGWNVRTTPVYWQRPADLTENGVTPASYERIGDRFATLRTNPLNGRTEQLGVVGKTWTPIQNEDMTGLLDALVGESGAHFETAGAMRGGRDVFFTMKLPEQVSVITPDGVHDAIDLNLVALNGHDGTRALHLIVTPIRVACANQQAAAIRSAVSRVSIRHTARAAQSIEEARRALGLVSVYAQEFNASAQALADAPMNFAESQAFFDRLVGVNDSGLSVRQENTRRERSDALRANLRNTTTLTDAQRTTRWGAYQSVTEYVDHLAPVRAGLWGEEAARVRAERVVSGNAEALKTRAFGLLTTV